jgi:undecaprenyl diphosphate synthase
LEKSKQALDKNNGLTLILALSYGSRAEIVDATRAIAEKASSREIDPQEIDEQLIADHLHTRHVPDPDLLIRTSGEMRLSNFLLWQISYSEVVITPTLWPDFRRPQFIDAIEEYARRHRRFGLL